MTTCQECGFGNPRRWIGCARCGQLLGPRFSAPDARTGTLDTRTTRRSPWPSWIDDQEAATSARATPEAESLELIQAPTLSDARPLLGQTALLDTLRANIALAFGERRSSLTLITGPAGSGRTRVLERASEFAAKHYMAVRVFYAACRNTEEGPYAPFSWLLLERFAITPASSPASVREQLMITACEILGGAAPAEQSMELAHLLGHVAGVPFPGSPALERLAASPRELRERAALAVRSLLQSDCGGGRLLILLDDMHRAEPDAWQMLEALVQVQAPIAFVISGDASVAAHLPPLAAVAQCSMAQLAPLGDTEVIELLKALLPSLREAPEPFVSALRHRSRGNPLALTELLRALEERGLFRPGASGLEVDLDKLARGELPLTMGDAIRARLAALDAAELAVLQHASVVGELFWDGALSAIARSELPELVAADPLSLWNDAAEQDQLEDALAVLETKRFVVRLSVAHIPGLSEYAFSFAGARALIYADLPESTRERWHATVAHWMTLAAGLPQEGLSAALARHLERARRHSHSAEAYLQAAAEERARLRTSMALRHIERALPLAAAAEAPLRIRVLHEHGSLLTTLGRYDEAHAAFTEIVQLSFRIGARGTGAAALSRIARVHRQRGAHILARVHFEEALELFQAADDQRGVAATHDDLAQVQRLLGSLEQALRSAQQALAIRSQSHDLRGQAVSRNTLGFIEIDRGNFNEAKAQLEAALAIRLSIADHEGAVQTRIGLGKLAYHQGRARDALHIYAVALDSARELGSRRFQAYLLNHLAEAHLASGSAETGQGLLLEAKRMAGALRDQGALSEIQRNLGLTALALRDPQAGQQLTAALDLARDYGTRHALALAHRSLARWQALAGGEHGLCPPEAAQNSFGESLRIFEECGSLHELARTQAELGFHLAELGQSNPARELLRQAYVTMKRLSLPELAQVGETLAQL
ncbi:MAG TPA: tetratricopeptide repeat protein [Polyangiales bacterium]|nr:tetratricopeptide repeat protein [Polyangiales bacterium]